MYRGIEGIQPTANDVDVTLVDVQYVGEEYYFWGDPIEPHLPDDFQEADVVHLPSNILDY